MSLGEVKTLAVDHCKMAVEVNISEGNNSKKFTIENAFGDHMPELMNAFIYINKGEILNHLS